LDWSAFADEYVDNIERRLCGRYVPDLIDLIQSIEAKQDGKPLKILDVGCGPGHLSLVLAQRGHTVFAVDYAPKMIDLLKQRTQGMNLNLFPMVMDGMTLEGIQDGDIDVTVSNFGVFLFPNRKLAWTNIHRVLKPTVGVLITTTWDTLGSQVQIEALKKAQLEPNNIDGISFFNGFSVAMDENETGLHNILSTSDWETLSDPKVFKQEVSDSGFEIIDVYALSHSMMFCNGDHYMKVFDAGPLAAKIKQMNEHELQEMRERVLRSVTNDPNKSFCLVSKCNMLYAVKP